MDKLAGSSVTGSAKSLAVALIMIFLSITLLVYGQELIQRVVNVQSFVKQTNDKSHQKNILLTQLDLSLSELGLKPSFDVFIKHKNKVEGAKVELYITKIQQSLTQYQAIDGISVTEAITLVKLSAIIENIQNSYFLASNLIVTNNNEKLLELADSINQSEIDVAITELYSANQQQAINLATISSRESNATLTFITLGAGFILLIWLAGLYILSLYRRHSIELIKLHQSDNQMTSIFQNAPQATISFNSNGQISRANTKAMALFDASLNQLQAMQVIELFCQQDQQDFTLFSEQALTAQTHQSKTPTKNINIVNQRGREVPVDICMTMDKSNNQSIGIITFRNMSDQKRTLKLMNENQLMLNQAQQIANIGSWNWELATDKLIWSDEAYRIYGYKPGEIEVTNDILMERIPPSERELVGNAINESVIFNKEYSIIHRIVRLDGSSAIVEEHGKVIRDEENKAVRMIGTVRDITQLKQTEQQLTLSANVFEHTTEAIVVTDADNKILQTNAAFKRISGFSNEDVCDQELDTILRANYFDQSFYHDIRSKLEANASWQGEIWNVRKDGEVYPTQQSISVIKDSNGDVAQYLYIFNDISQHKLAEKNIREIAQFDQLTLLPNRSVFIERLKQTIITSGKNKLTAVFSISLNRPILENRTLAKHDKDQLISSTAKLISHLIRKQDSVMRAGDNEFNVIIRDLSSSEDAYIIAEKIIKELTMPLALSQKKVIPGCCIGIALHPTHTSNYYDLIKCADAAMSVAKTANANANGSEVFNSNMLAQYSDEDHQGNELRRAVELQELSIYFEPQINLKDQRLKSVTAKITWLHPELGNISYDNFKHVAEQAGLIDAIFNWLLEEACKQASQWSTSSLGNTTVDIEISPSMLSQPGLSKTISNILTTYQLKPQRLRLEMTEQTILNCPEIAITELEKIKALGVEINFMQLGQNYSTVDDIKRIGFNSVTTMSGSSNHDTYSSEILAQMKQTIKIIDSLPLSEALTQIPVMASLTTITDVEDLSCNHFMTGRQLGYEDLLELSNAINAHNVLLKRKAKT